MRLILFDVDGTLVDSQSVLLESQRRTLARHGFAHPGREKGLAIVGLSLHEAFAALMGPGVDPGPLVATYRTVFSEMRLDPAYESPLFEGVPDLLDTLASRDDVILGLATGKSRRGVAHLIEREGWHGRFGTVQTADTNPSKPDPGMVIAAMAETGIPPERTVVVGDTTFDMEMARFAGADAVGVAWGNHPARDVKAAGARIVVTRVPDLLQAIFGD